MPLVPFSWRLTVDPSYAAELFLRQLTAENGRNMCSVMQWKHSRKETKHIPYQFPSDNVMQSTWEKAIEMQEGYRANIKIRKDSNCVCIKYVPKNFWLLSQLGTTQSESGRRRPVHERLSVPCPSKAIS